MPALRPGVHPETELRPTTSDAEQAVYRALKSGLPPGWTAWHSLRLRDRKATFGEGDFVLAHPERGILYLEVKGGQIELRDGRWFQNGAPLGRSPLDQAHRFRNLLLRRFQELRLRPPSIGQAPCFPDTDFDVQPTQDDLRGIVIGKRQLQWLSASLPLVVGQAVPPPAHNASPGWMERLHELWGETWIPGLSLGTRARDAALRRLSLDDAQLEVLEGALENARVLVQGGAGSGKTLVAVEAARRLAAQGKRVLLLCFTAPLRKWLAARLEGSGVEVHTVSGLARRLEAEAGRAPPSGTILAADGWRQAFLVAAEVCAPSWDAVVVDEAQDLQAEAWDFVKALAPGRGLVAFHDPGQGYWPERTPPRALFGAFSRLPRQQRCPPGVQALASRCLGAPFDEAALEAGRRDGSVAGVPVGEGEAAGALVAAEVGRLLAAGLSIGDVGIVSLRGQTAQEPGAPIPACGAHEPVRADAEEMELRLVHDTFLRWKGLERPAILVTDLSEELQQLPVRLNVAITRATVAVRLVGEGAALGRLGL